ncbi:hypothetical protein NEOKW01_0366 [Nematocida sp. AWRm80]|nr:hypothetical protein NEOKW01_0366 [Nematocida sp. AWRm80]
MNNKYRTSLEYSKITIPNTNPTQYTPKEIHTFLNTILNTTKLHNKYMNNLYKYLNSMNIYNKYKVIVNTTESTIISSVNTSLINIIRVNILDIITTEYTNTKYKIQVEEWVNILIYIIDTVIYKEYRENKSSYTTLTEHYLAVGNDLVNKIAQEIREIFINKNSLFGSKGNLLVMDILYIQEYFKDLGCEVKVLDGIIDEVQKKFKDRKEVEETSDLKKMLFEK